MGDELKILIICGAVAIALLGAGWTQFLAHQRRAKALDVIKAAIERGREAPPEVYALLGEPAERKSAWGEVIVFSALGVGFWIAYAIAEAEDKFAFLVVAATMSVTSLGCLVLTLVRRDVRRDEPGADDDAG